MNALLLKSYASIQRFYLSLSLRDQRAFLFLLVVGLPFTLWFGIESPLEKARLRSQIDYNASRGNFEWMQAHAYQAQGSSSPDSDPIPDMAVFTHLITSAAYDQQITISHMQQEAGSLHVEFEKVPFNQLLLFLTNLKKRGINPVRITIAKLAAYPGLVSTAMVLSLRQSPR